MSSDSKYICAYIYILLNGIFFLFASIYCDIWTKDSSNNSAYPTGFMNQVGGDWNSTMLNDITVVSGDDYCPDDYPEITYGRRFYGTGIACDCIGINSRWITGANTMNLDAVCTYN
jgi:hypothetical protein